MKRYLWLALVVVVVLASSGVASASWVKSGDRSINLLPGLNTGLGLVSTVGNLALDLQESVHIILTGTTGLEIDHSYLWVGVGGEYLPLDPIYIYGD